MLDLSDTTEFMTHTHTHTHTRLKRPERWFYRVLLLAILNIAGFSIHAQTTSGLTFRLRGTDLFLNPNSPGPGMVTTPNYYQMYDSSTVPILNICEGTEVEF